MQEGTLTQQLWDRLAQIPNGLSIVQATAGAFGSRRSHCDDPSSQEQPSKKHRGSVTKETTPISVMAALLGTAPESDTTEPQSSLPQAAHVAFAGWLDTSTIRNRSQQIRHINRIYPICQWRCLCENPNQQWRAWRLLSQSVAQVLTATVKEALNVHDWILQHLRQPRGATVQMQEFRIFSLNPGRTGLVGLKTRQVQENKIFGVNGLLPFAERRQLQCIALPGAMLPEGFQFSSEQDWSNVCRGGVHAASSAVWWHQAANIQKVILASPPSATHPDRGIASIITVADKCYLMVLSYLKTAGGIANDDAWIEQATETSDFIIKSVKEMGLHGWLWVGDFNFQPIAITGARDPSKRRHNTWTLIHKKLACETGGEPILLNPLRQHAASVKQTSTSSVPRWATQSDGNRGIDLCSSSRSLEGMVELILHNGVHCREEGRCNDEQCIRLCNSDHWGLEIVLRVSGAFQQERPEPPKKCRSHEHWQTVTYDMRHLLAYWVDALGPVEPQLRLGSDNAALRDGMELLAHGLEVLHYIGVLRALVPGKQHTSSALQIRPPDKQSQAASSMAGINLL